jgi:regulator of protease activity HflC (stomatin/prohibitin superfamily)
MNDLITRIISLIENLLVLPLVWLFPIKWTIIPPGSNAVRFTFGKPSTVLKPGIHFATTGQTLHKQHTNTKLGTAESMYVLTEDGVSLKIRGVVIYKIISLVKYLTATEDSEEFVIEACEAAIRDAISLVPFEDLVTDSNTIENTICRKISEICEELGILIKRYRFQDVEFTDPISRALSSVNCMESKLTKSAKKMTESLSISHKDALAILSPNIQFVSNIVPSEQYESDREQEEVEEK